MPSHTRIVGEANISYICSRFYRAPKLIFGATEYTTSIDIWSAGCVLAALLLGQVLGTPTREEIRCMNPDYTDFKFPQIKAHPWHKVFQKRMPPEAIDLASRLLQYSPSLRCTVMMLMKEQMTEMMRVQQEQASMIAAFVSTPASFTELLARGLSQPPFHINHQSSDLNETLAPDSFPTI